MAKQKRFIDNGNNTVTDTETGKTWVQDHCALPVAAFAEPMNDVENIAAIKELNRIKFAGHSDWRVGKRFEVESTLDLKRSNPAIDPIFRNTKSSWYRTSTPVHGDSGYAWCVGFFFGSVYSYGKGYSYFVRPCRSSK